MRQWVPLGVGQPGVLMVSTLSNCPVLQQLWMSHGRRRGFTWSFCVPLGSFCVYYLFFSPVLK